MSVLNLPFLLKMIGTSSQSIRGFSLGSEEVPGSWCGLEMAGLDGRHLSVYVVASCQLPSTCRSAKSLSHVWIAPQCWVPWPCIARSILRPQKPLGVALDLSVLTHCTDTPSALMSYWLREFQSLPTPSNEAQIHSALGFPILSRGSFSCNNSLAPVTLFRGKGPAVSKTKLCSTVSTSHMWSFRCNWVTYARLAILTTSWVLSNHMWLVVTTLKNTVFIIEHCYHPRKFCWQHRSRICALYLVLTLSGAISESVSKLGWKRCPLYMIIQSHTHPALYLGLGFETQKPRTGSFVLHVLLNHLSSEAQKMGCSYYHQSQQLVQFAGTERIPGNETFHLKTRKVPNNPGQFGHLSSKEPLVTKECRKEYQSWYLKVASTL